MRIARVRLFSLFGAMLFLLNLLTSNVIYHNICILSTLILRNLMYLKSIDELPAPFPLPAFITFHRLSIPSVAFQCLPSPFITLHRFSLPSVAFHYLSSPFIAFHRLSLPFIAFITFHRLHYLSSPPHLIVRPLSAPPFCPRLSPLSHHAPFYPHLAPFRPHLAAFCPRLAPFCPHLAQLSRHAPFYPHLAQLSRHAPASHTCFHPASSPPLFHTAVFHAPLSAPLCFTPSIVLHPFVLLPPPLLYSFPLFCVLCFTSSPFALLFPIVLRPLFYSLPLCFIYSHCFTSFVLLHPPLLYLLPLFCTRFFTPRQPPQTRPRHRKRQRFSHFSKKFCKKPLTK